MLSLARHLRKRRDEAHQRRGLDRLPNHLRRDVGLPERDATEQAVVRRLNALAPW